MGLYVNITTLSIYTPTGTAPTPTTNNITLYPGWNLVGFPSTQGSVDVSTALSGITYQAVEVYDDPTRQFVRLSGSDYMEPGRGYWIYCNTTSTQEWNVP